MKYLYPGSETPRLRFRLLENSDFDEWLPLFSTAEAETYLGLASIPTPEKRCRKWFDNVQNRYDKDLGGMHVLVSKQENRIIGQAGLLVQEVDNQPELEIGYSTGILGHGVRFRGCPSFKGTCY